MLLFFECLYNIPHLSYFVNTFFKKMYESRASANTIPINKN